MASSLFQIPGNIKQQFLPFVLHKPEEPGEEPGSLGISRNVATSNELNPSDPQVFSFRTNVPYMWSGTGKLNICPSSFEKFMNKDISNQLLFSKDNKGKSVTFGDIYNSLPKIQIREFLPDTRLDQALNMFGDFIGKIMEIFNASKKGQDTTNQQVADDKNNKGFFENFSLDKIADKIKDLGSDFKNIIQHAWNYMTGVTQPDNLFIDASGKSRFSGYRTDMYTNNGMLATYVMGFPWLMYYKLQTCVTTNIYEVPNKISNNLIMTSDGSSGWDGTSVASVTNATSKIPIIGGILDKFMQLVPGMDLLQNIRVNYMPYWDSKSGSKTAHPAIEITFDLFNDTEKAAMINFIFINTVIPNNRWIQYNMFQHSPCLYDIKIEGLNRLYACTGKFDVTYSGVLREPPDVWIDTLVKQYGNTNVIKPSTNEFIKKQKLIKIPDVYHVKMTFQSILPNNFNNFIFSYSQNINSLETYYTKVYDESQMTQAVTDPVASFFEEMTDYIASGKYNSDSNLDKTKNFKR